MPAVHRHAHGVIFVAEIVYRWVSRNRYVLSRMFGCKEACAVMPQRRRANERVAADATQG
jgi:predicted DCC family thiol-disulfide oxidoreductase YuxK